MIEDRPIVLLYPPPSDPTQPYSSLPVLTGYLREKGFRVIQRDLGIELLDELLTPEVLREARSAAIFKEKNINEELKAKYLERFYGIIGLSDYVIENIIEAKQLMRDKKLFYDVKRYQWAVTIINLACDLVSLPYHPTSLKPCDYETSGDLNLTLQGLLDTTSRSTDNLFFETFKQKIVPQILEMNPLLVGISTTYGFQIVPAFTLSRLLKLASPDLHVNIGGAVIYCMESQLLSDVTCFQFADSFVVGEGETALLTLAKSLVSGEELRSIPNLILKIEDRPYASNLRWYEDINNLPCPDFDGLELDRYLSPEPILLLPSSRGCYYGKCAFCDVSMNTRQVYRQLKSKRLTDNVTRLYLKYGAKRFFFCDNAMPPANMLEVAHLVKDKLYDVTWKAEVRFDKMMTSEYLSTLREGGCRQLIFGLESASQRVLDVMNKNNSIENDIEVLRSCSANGISVSLLTFIGFPTETSEEAWETVNFLTNNEGYIASAGFGLFSLFKDTPVYKNPKCYNLSSISIPEKELLVSCNYVPLCGMTREDAKREYELAKEKLDCIYCTRHYYLGRVIGAHSLLHFSHYEYNEIHQIWEGIDASKDTSNCLASSDINDLVLIISPTLLFSYPPDQTHAFNLRIICSHAGAQYSLSPMEQRLLGLFDGKRTVDEITSIWVKEQSQELNKQVLLLANAFTIIKEFLRNGFILKSV